jgi:peptide-methionine (S)-S-oxide reductase
MRQATFGAGCFWGVQQQFDSINGVKKTTVGYMGGTTRNPTYEQVCSHTTGHAEVVNIEFDETIVSYEELLDIFWKIHDPTQKDRQGVDVGSQYRSVIFYHSDEQKKKAQEAKSNLEKSGRFRNSVVTEIMAESTFYPADEYHQKYFKKHGVSGCPISL